VVDVGSGVAEPTVVGSGVDVAALPESEQATERSPITIRPISKNVHAEVRIAVIIDAYSRS
jgi:hypothetical protein